MVPAFTDGQGDKRDSSVGGGNDMDADLNGGGFDASVGACTPRTCTQLDVTCGPQGDGCGGVVDCGKCASNETCGAGGPSKCGKANPSCVPKTCTDLGASCGKQGDGCGNVIDREDAPYRRSAAAAERPASAAAAPPTPTAARASPSRRPARARPELRPGGRRLRRHAPVRRLRGGPELRRRRRGERLWQPHLHAARRAPSGRQLRPGRRRLRRRPRVRHLRGAQTCGGGGMPTSVRRRCQQQLRARQDSADWPQLRPGERRLRRRPPVRDLHRAARRAAAAARRASAAAPPGASEDLRGGAASTAGRSATAAAASSSAAPARRPETCGGGGTPSVGGGGPRHAGRTCVPDRPSAAAPPATAAAASSSAAPARRPSVRRAAAPAVRRAGLCPQDVRRARLNCGPARRRLRRRTPVRRLHRAQELRRRRQPGWRRLRWVLRQPAAACQLQPAQGVGGGHHGSVCGVPATCDRPLPASRSPAPAPRDHRRDRHRGRARPRRQSGVPAADGTDPLPNALVYVPNAPVLPTSRRGVSPRACQLRARRGSPLVKRDDRRDGTFTLQNVPVGTNIPLVIQLGRWRRQVTIPSVAACMNTAVSAGAHALAAQAEARATFPLMAFATGAVDSLECVMRKIGVDDPSSPRQAAPGASSSTWPTAPTRHLGRGGPRRAHRQLATLEKHDVGRWCEGSADYDVLYSPATRTQPTPAADHHRLRQRRRAHLRHALQLRLALQRRALLQHGQLAG